LLSQVATIAIITIETATSSAAPWLVWPSGLPSQIAEVIVTTVIAIATMIATIVMTIAVTIVDTAADMATNDLLFVTAITDTTRADVIAQTDAIVESFARRLRASIATLLRLKKPAPAGFFVLAKKLAASVLPKFVTWRLLLAFFPISRSV
jgi:hypothetical protein